MRSLAKQNFKTTIGDLITMKTLIIANRINGGVFDATMYNDTMPNFSYLLDIASSQEMITNDNVNTIQRGVIINDNIEDIENLIRYIGFRKCDECGAWVTPQDVRTGASTYDRDTYIRLCPACVLKHEMSASREKKITLSGYHSTSGNVRVINGEGENYTLDNVLGIGIEMEANAHSRIVRNNQINVTDAFFALANPHSRNKIFRCEQDGTVQAEIISNIFTKKSMYAFDWNILTDTLKLMGNDESIANVGFHVHLSKLWLGDTPKVQALNFLKLQYFLKSYENDFFKMSGRRRNEMEWCNFYSMSSIEEMKNCIIASNDNNAWSRITCSHSYALIQSGATIELRIGKSTNDPIKIANYLKLILGIVENVKNVPFEKCYCIGKMTRLVPNDVMNYWRRNGCFLNTNALENRGVALSATL